MSFILFIFRSFIHYIYAFTAGVLCCIARVRRFKRLTLCKKTKEDTFLSLLIWRTLKTNKKISNESTFGHLLLKTIEFLFWFEIDKNVFFLFSEMTEKANDDRIEEKSVSITGNYLGFVFTVLFCILPNITLRLHRVQSAFWQMPTKPNTYKFFVVLIRHYFCLPLQCVGWQIK